MLEAIMESPEIMNAIITLIALVLTSLVSILSIKVHAYIETLRNEKMRSVASNAYSHLAEVVMDAVAYTKQTMVDDVKTHGKMSKEIADAALFKARDYVLKNTSAAILDVVKEEFGDLDDLIIALIEAKIGQSKK
jgi:hypothetical protein